MGTSAHQLILGHALWGYDNDNSSDDLTKNSDILDEIIT
jgi:hypothetical protein